jgi:hypothetical protein
LVSKQNEVPAKVWKLPNLPKKPGARVEHSVEVAPGDQLYLVFESVASPWKQGVQLQTDGVLQVDTERYRRGVVVFQHENEPELSIRVVKTSSRLLWVWNVWDNRKEPPRATIAKDGNCGMLVERLPNGFRYRCNDGFDDEDYDDLVFRLERGTSEQMRRNPPSERRERTA